MGTLILQEKSDLFPMRSSQTNNSALTLLGSDSVLAPNKLDQDQHRCVYRISSTSRRRELDPLAWRPDPAHANLEFFPDSRR